MKKEEDKSLLTNCITPILAVLWVNPSCILVQSITDMQLKQLVFENQLGNHILESSWVTRKPPEIPKQSNL